MFFYLNNLMKREASCFKLFYSFQTLIAVFGLIRGTSFGYILHQLDVSPFYLSLFFIIGIFSNFICYYLFPYFNKKFKNSLKVMIAFEVICFVSLLISTLYLFYLSYIGSFGNYWIWGILNLFLFLPVFGSLSVRPLLVKEKFPKNNYKTIIRLDLICVSASKLIGFSLGAIIISINYVLLFFILGLIISGLAIYFYVNLSRTHILYHQREEQNEDKNEQKDVYYNPILTYLIVFIPTTFLVGINVQAVFIDKIFGIPFYITPLLTSLGGLTFNLLLNKNLSLNLDKRFFIQGGLVVICFLNFSIFKSAYILVPSLFLLGGIYTTLSNMATSRIYSYSITRVPKSISRYYGLISLLNVLGTLFIGILLENIAPKYSFLIWASSIFIIFTLIYLLNKKINFDKLH